MKRVSSKLIFILHVFLLSAVVIAGCSSPSPDIPLQTGHEEVQEEKETAPGKTGETGSADEKQEEIAAEQKEALNETCSPPESKNIAAAENEASAEKKERESDEEVIPEEKAPEERSPDPEEAERKTGTHKDMVSILIKGPSEVGTILETTKIERDEGDTVLDILRRATQKERIQMDYRGRGSTVYIEGIDNIYEFDHGPESGWIYSVNGYFPERSSGAWKVENGDLVTWFYSKSLGRDLDISP